MKIYSKNQFFIIGFLLTGFLYSIYSFIKYKNAIEKGIQVEKLVISQSCKPCTRFASGVMISVGNKTHHVKLDYGNCIKYPVNSKIKVVYDKERDTFIFPVKVYNTGRIYLLGILLLISTLPWLYFIKKNNPFVSICIMLIIKMKRKILS